MRWTLHLLTKKKIYLYMRLILQILEDFLLSRPKGGRRSFLYPGLFTELLLERVPAFNSYFKACHPATKGEGAMQGAIALSQGVYGGSYERVTGSQRVYDAPSGGEGGA